MPYMVHEGLMKHFPALEIVDAATIWVQITAIKHPKEIEHVRAAVRVADCGMDAAIAAIRPGLREQAVSAEAVYAMRKNGSEFEPFIPLVASGYNTSMFERVATEKMIEAGEMVILDIGAVVHGYTGDLGRTVHLRRPDAGAEGDLQGNAARPAGSEEGSCGPARAGTTSTIARGT